MVDDPPRRLVWATEPDRPEVHLPESVVDLLEADVQLGEDVAHVHPPAAPANAAVATHAPHFIMPGYVIGKSAAGYGRGDAWYRLAGRRWPRAAGGTSQSGAAGPPACAPPG